jgi:hypothetical protein
MFESPQYRTGIGAEFRDPAHAPENQLSRRPAGPPLPVSGNADSDRLELGVLAPSVTPVSA